MNLAKGGSRIVIVAVVLWIGFWSTKALYGYTSPLNYRVALVKQSTGDFFPLPVSIFCRPSPNRNYYTSITLNDKEFLLMYCGDYAGQDIKSEGKNHAANFPVEHKIRIIASRDHAKRRALEDNLGPLFGGPVFLLLAIGTLGWILRGFKTTNIHGNSGKSRIRACCRGAYEAFGGGAESRQYFEIRVKRVRRRQLQSG